jgi:tape measure domain-containing protein
MAKLGDLVVRIGADTRGLNKSLGKVQRNMRSMTSNFTKLGTSMSKAITLPLLGIAAMAVKSAADLEKMETGFISLAGGASEAAAMMKQLNDFTAKTPFQIEAVATAARQLIASGTGIGEVNEQLQFLGDIAATTGQPINEIAAIFAKVNAKGKVELENLNQLAERGIPVFKGLADATGLLPSELGAGAVTVQQFNDYLKGLSKEGGFAEGAMERLSQTASGKFSTALDNLKLAGASLAESLLPILSDLLDYVVDLAQSFVDLSPSTKKMILIFGGVAAAIGPLLVMIPGLLAALPLITTAFVAMTGPIGLAVGAVVLLVAAFLDVNKQAEESAGAMGKLDKEIKKSFKAIAEQTANVRFLVYQYGQEKTSLEDRKRILNELAIIDVEHYGNLDATTTSMIDLEAATRSYIGALKEKGREEAIQNVAKGLLEDIGEQQAAVVAAEERAFSYLESHQFLIGKFDENGKMVAGAMDGLGAVGLYQLDMYSKRLGLIKTTESRLNKGLTALSEFRERYESVFEEDIEVVITPPVGGGGGGGGVGGLQDLPTEGSLDALQRTVTLLTDRLKDAKIGSDEFMATQYDLAAATLLLDDAIASMSPTLKETQDPIHRLLWDLTNFGVAVEDTAEKVADSVRTMSDDINDAVSDAVGTMISGVAEMVGAAIGAQKPIEGVGKFLGNVLGDMAINLGTYAIMHGTVIEALKKSLKSLNGTLAIIAGITLVALGAGLKGMISRSATDAGVPALAEGGLIYGPSLALVGDNKNANIDPEVVAPLSKLKGMLGGNSVQVYGRISGDDIVISNSRASRDRNRF